MADLKLPRMEGLEVLRRLRADRRGRFVPAVILSTSSEEKDLREAYSWGANSYLRKPVDFQRFVEMLQTMVEYWLLLNRVPPPDGGR